MRFAHATQGTLPFFRDLLGNGHFGCVAWAESHVAEGEETGLTNERAFWHSL